MLSNLIFPLDIIPNKIVASKNTIPNILFIYTPIQTPNSFAISFAISLAIFNDGVSFPNSIKLIYCLVRLIFYTSFACVIFFIFLTSIILSLILLYPLINLIIFIV